MREFIWRHVFPAGIVFLFVSVPALAQGEAAAAAPSAALVDVDVLWTCLAAFLVFFMQAGFALVECGFTRAKNACNIMMKNLMDFSDWLTGFLDGWLSA